MWYAYKTPSLKSFEIGGTMPTWFRGDVTPVISSREWNKPAGVYRPYVRPQKIEDPTRRKAATYARNLGRWEMIEH